VVRLFQNTSPLNTRSVYLIVGAQNR